MLKILRYSDYPQCCGIKILSSFGWSTTNPNCAGPRDLELMEEDLKALSNYKSFGLFLVAISDEQKPHVEYLLKKYEYRPIIKDFFHPGHHKNITLYARVLHNQNATKVDYQDYGTVKEPPSKVVRASTTKPRSTSTTSKTKTPTGKTLSRYPKVVYW